MQTWHSATLKSANQTKDFQREHVALRFEQHEVKDPQRRAARWRFRNYSVFFSVRRCIWIVYLDAKALFRLKPRQGSKNF